MNLEDERDVVERAIVAMETALEGLEAVGAHLAGAKLASALDAARAEYGRRTAYLRGA